MSLLKFFQLLRNTSSMLGRIKREGSLPNDFRRPPSPRCYHLTETNPKDATAKHFFKNMLFSIRLVFSQFSIISMYSFHNKNRVIFLNSEMVRGETFLEDAGSHRICASPHRQPQEGSCLISWPVCMPFSRG